MPTDGRIPARQIQGVGGGGLTTDDVPQLLVLTTEINGVPELVWDDSHNLVYAEGPTT